MIRNWMKMLLAILLGNLLYFVALPALPEAARHHLYHVDPGLLLDFIVCFAIYVLMTRQPQNKQR